MSQRHRNRLLLLEMVLKSWVFVLIKNEEQTRAKTARRIKENSPGVFLEFVLLVAMALGVALKLKATAMGNVTNQRMRCKCQVFLAFENMTERRGQSASPKDDSLETTKRIVYVTS